LRKPWAAAIVLSPNFAACWCGCNNSQKKDRSTVSRNESHVLFCLPALVRTWLRDVQRLYAPLLPALDPGSGQFASTASLPFRFSCRNASMTRSSDVSPAGFGRITFAPAAGASFATLSLYRKQNDLCFRQLLFENAGSLNPIQARHSYIQYEKVWLKRERFVHRLQPILRLRAHFHPRSLL
jgi:hypothetical protein